MAWWVWPHGSSESTIWSDSLEDLSAARRSLKIYGIYVFSHVTIVSRVVYSNVDGFFSISGNLVPVFVYYLCERCWLKKVVGNAVYVNCTDDITIFVLLPYFPNICWILLCKKGSNFFQGQTVCRLCFNLVVIEFIFRKHMGSFKGVGSLADDLYPGVLKDSTKVITEIRNIGNRDETFFWLLGQYLDLWWKLVVSSQVLWSSNLDSYFWRKKSMEVVHFFG